MVEHISYQLASNTSSSSSGSMVQQQHWHQHLGAAAAAVVLKPAMVLRLIKKYHITCFISTHEKLAGVAPEAVLRRGWGQGFRIKAGSMQPATW